MTMILAGAKPGLARLASVAKAIAVACACICGAPDGVAQAQASPWRDEPIARLEATALLASFEAALLSGESATATLERWCEVHGLANPARISAERVPGDKPAPSDVLRELRLTSPFEVRYRRVRLKCGAHVLSEADNWYAPARLTPEMNRVLDTSDEPFGRVVKPLSYARRTRSATLLWRPLPEHWEVAGGTATAGGPATAGRAAATASARSRATAPRALPIPARLLSVRAELVLPDGTPFSVVDETYSGEILAFPQPHLPHVID